MKKLYVLIFSMLLINSAFAEKCSLVIPWGAGGSSDLAARALQKGNTDITIDYKPGAFASVAISHLANNPGSFLLSAPVMLSPQNPNKNINIDVIRVMYGFDMSIVTGKNINMEDLLSKKINLGIPGVGIINHAIALELKQYNPNIEIVITGNDSKTLPLLMNGDIDAYIGIANASKQWIQGFKNIKMVLDLPFGEKISFKQFNFTNYGFHGVMIHKSASSNQKVIINECLDVATSSLEFKVEAIKLGLKIINAKDTKSTEIVNSYLDSMKKHGL